MKGIVLAGGSGTRLYPVTKGVSKQLIPIYDKPMVYYPISVLMLAGIREILIITTPEDSVNYINLLGDGSSFGINITYQIQPTPDGLAQAFILGENFIGNENVCLVLGDNVFYGQGLSPKLEHSVKLAQDKQIATIFGYQVKDPERYGVVDFDNRNQAISIEEKPKVPKSNFAVTGLYFYPNSVIDMAKSIKPSHRNELEITSINNGYLDLGRLNVEVLGRGFAWMDTGTHDSLLEASQFVQTVERSQGYKIACLEEIAFLKGWLNKKEILKISEMLGKGTYRDYVLSLVDNNS